MEQITSKRSDILHVHSCGRQGLGDFIDEFKRRGYGKCKNIVASEYIYDMPIYLKAADVVMCRSGAMTLSELATAGVASVLIPSPNVTNNHQLKNAMEFSAKNAAFVIDEKKNGDKENAVRYVRDLINHRELRDEMSRNATCFAHPDASEIIARNIINAVMDDKA